MIALNEDQRRALEKGEPVRTTIGAREVVLLQGKMYRAILSLGAVEKAVIALGPGRQPLPEPLEDPELSNMPDDGQDLAILRADRFDEIRACVEDARAQQAWLQASHQSAVEWMKENPY